MARESGYYKVKIQDMWLIAHYQNGTWELCGTKKQYRDEDFQEIGEMV